METVFDITLVAVILLILGALGLWLICCGICAFWDTLMTGWHQSDLVTKRGDLE